MQADKDDSFYQNYLYRKEYKSDKATLNQEETYHNIKTAISILPIDQKFFEAVFDLVKTWKFATLVLLEPAFKKINSDAGLSKAFEAEIKKVAKTALVCFDDQKIPDLEFLFEKGVDEQFDPEIKIAKKKKETVDYFIKLSEKKAELKDLVLEGEEQLEDVDEFLTMVAPNKLTYFETRFEEHIKRYGIELRSRLTGKTQEEVIDKKNLSQKEAHQTEEQNKQNPKNQTQQSVNKNTSVPTQEDLEQLRKVPLCCRTFFYFQELIHQPQTVHFCYRFWDWPLRERNYSDLSEIVCSLLNADGGYCLVGIREDRRTLKKEAIGYEMTEAEAGSQIKAMYQAIQDCVKPTVKSSAFKVVKIPIKDFHNGKYLPGRYVLKICVKLQNKRTVYSYTETEYDKKEHFPFKTEGGISIETSIQRIFETVRERRQNQQPMKPLIHEGVCSSPEIGLPVYDGSGFTQKSQNIDFPSLS